MTYTIKKQIRKDTPQVGVKPYRQIHVHSTGNPKSTAQNEADYMNRKDLNSGFFTHVVGNGVVIQTANTNRGAWDVGGAWNVESYAAIELIESHTKKADFEKDYKIYCELIYNLAKEAGIPITIDTADLAGIKTHNYCTHHQPNNNSDHVDPIPYLKKWGITLEQFRKDVASFGAKKVTTPVAKKIRQNKTFRIGDTVTVQTHATKWATGESIPKWVQGSKYKVIALKHQPQSSSTQRLLLDKVNSWVLGQDCCPKN